MPRPTAPGVFLCLLPLQSRRRSSGNWHFLTRKLRDAAREFCAFERAEAATRREAERVLNLLKSNAGWRVRVWESLDWRWRLYYRGGRLSLWPRRATTASTVCSRCPPGGRPALQRRPHPLLGSAERGHPISAEHGAAKYWSDFQRKVSGALGEATPVEEPSRRQIQTPDLNAADAMQLTTYAYAFSQLAQYCNMRTGSILAGAITLNQKSTASCGGELYRRLPACAERWRQP